MKISTAIAAVCAFAPIVSAAAAAAAPALEVRFYPDRELRLQPLNEQRGVQSALLQNAAILNRGDAPVILDSVTLDLLAAEATVQSQPFAGGALAALAARSGRIAASGAIEAYPFQFAPEKLLAGAKPVGATTLAPGEALLLGSRVFAIQGAADRLRLAVVGHAANGSRAEGRGELPIANRPPSSGYVFPLAGAWYVGAGASFHSHHRWAVPEEFALDIGRLGENGRTHRGDGARNEDFYAWEAPVRAVADGKVVRTIDRFVDSDAMLQAAGESPEAYQARIQQQQGALLQQGLEAIGGNVVVIEHPNGEYSHYLHLRHGSLSVKVGDAVKRGQTIARLGNTGNSTEPHLHFQVTDGPDPLLSAGVPVAFEAIEILLADGPRAPQTGDVIEAK
jgi:murein DD-endopeptidase MepM/ murein hydrolase activator NlpD